MSPPKLAAAEARAHAAEDDVRVASGDNGTLGSLTKAAELYMQALTIADTPTDKKRLAAKCRQLLARAEILKKNKSASGPRTRDLWPARPTTISTQGYDAGHPVSTRELTAREQIILLKGSRLNGFEFRQWQSAPPSSIFQQSDPSDLFVDFAHLALSPPQLQAFAGWKRPAEALAAIKIHRNGTDLPTEPTMLPEGPLDLVQDLTSDCSVVASLCAGTARAERGHSKLMRWVLHPYDLVNDSPAFSPNGKYILRFHFNGCWRNVEIDDLLPVSGNSRTLHVIDRAHPGLLWPALVEKAYLKVRGGYDFPGSNSCTDIAVFTGWIPEQIFLHNEETVPDELWDNIFDEFNNGNLLLTVGTGKLPKREQRLLGLAAEHDYAVLDLKERGGIREMLIKNPWSDGDVWRGATRRRPNPSHDYGISSPFTNGSTASSAVDEMLPGTFWMDFASVFQYFENFYLNWNPANFSSRQDLHFTWEVSATGISSGCFVLNRQFSLRSERDGEVWILLNRHFRTGDYTSATKGANGYISLYLFHRGGQRVLLSEGAARRGPFVDSPNTLLKVNLSAGTAETIVVVCQDLLPSEYHFTISAFSSHPLNLELASLKYRTDRSIAAAWTRATAGGNSESSRYLTNPQFKTCIASKADVAFVLQVDAFAGSKEADYHVKVVLIYSDGSRITNLRSRIKAHSGDYRKGSAVIETTLEKGSYTIICSTFDVDQKSKFTLAMFSSVEGPLDLSLLAAEGSGRLSIKSAPAVLTHETNRLLAPLTIPRLTRGIFIVRELNTSQQAGAKNSSLVKLSLEGGQGPYKSCYVSSAVDDSEFREAAAGVRIEDYNMRPEMSQSACGGLWLVLERLPRVSKDDAADEAFQVEMLTEERVELGPWGRGDG